VTVQGEKNADGAFSLEQTNLLTVGKRSGKWQEEQPQIFWWIFLTVDPEWKCRLRGSSNVRILQSIWQTFRLVSFPKWVAGLRTARPIWSSEWKSLTNSLCTLRAEGMAGVIQTSFSKKITIKGFQLCSFWSHHRHASKSRLFYQLSNYRKKTGINWFINYSLARRYQIPMWASYIKKCIMKMTNFQFLKSE